MLNGHDLGVIISFYSVVLLKGSVHRIVLFFNSDNAICYDLLMTYVMGLRMEQ